MFFVKNDKLLTEYKKFVEYVIFDLSVIAQTEPRILEGMRRFGKFGSRDAAAYVIDYGTPPGIVIDHIPGGYMGEYILGQDVVRIDSLLASCSPHLIRQWSTPIDGTAEIHTSGITILHEIVHWREYLGGNTSEVEEGDAFERYVFGYALADLGMGPK